MEPGKGRVVGRARGRPVPTQSTAQSAPGMPAAPAAAPPMSQQPQEIFQPPGFQPQKTSQPVDTVGGRAILRGTGHSHLGMGDVSQLSLGSSSTASVQEESREKSKARRGMYYDTIRSRPKHIESKLGSTGDPVKLVTNLFRLVNRSNFSFHHFHVSFNPEIVNPRIRRGMIHQIKEIGIHLFDGTSLYLPRNLDKPEMEFTVQRLTDNTPVIIRVRHVALLSPSSPVCIQVFNIIFKKVLNHIGLQMIQRNYFNPHQAQDFEKYKLTIWPGYITSILQYEQDTSLMADISHKILSTSTVLDKLTDIYTRNKGSYQELSKAELCGSIVMTRYNNKTYKVDDIDWEQTPKNSFKLRDDTMQTYVDYYKKHHDLVITDFRQPLIIVMPSKRERRAGNEGPIFLIPELCYMTGLSDNARKDMTMMRELASHTRIGPHDRINTLRGFLNQINQNEKAVTELKNWNLELDRDLMELSARVLYAEGIALGPNPRTKTREIVYNRDAAEWSREMKGFPLLEPAVINNWVFVFTRRDENYASDFAHALSQSARELGMTLSVDSCMTYPISDNSVTSYMKALRESVNQNTQFVMVLLPSARQDLYSSIKTFLCVDVPVPSQVMLGKTVSKPQMLRSVANKVAIQINSKMGKQCWAVKIPLDNVLVIGIDTYHDSQKKGRSVMGVVGSLNKNLNTFYTCWNFQSSQEELGRGLTNGVTGILMKYTEVNQKLPSKIIIYRDGVGDGQLRMVIDFEIDQILKAFGNFGDSYKPAFAFVVVQKRVNSRFFVQDQNTKNYKNPGPGTVVDSAATRPEWYDFFVVSQSVRQGTVTPTHYNVIYDTSGLKPDHMQHLTYKLCHLYYNWQGTIRVPAPCMFAHKVAFLIGQSIHKCPSNALADKLFYL